MAAQEHPSPQFPKLPKKALMKERKSPRGLVPTALYGRYDEPYNQYLTELDPRGTSPQGEAVRFALAAARDLRFREFLARLSMPQYMRYSLAALAKSCDISLPEWAEFWQKASTQRALAQVQIALPALTADMLGDARTTAEVCSRCDGLGWIRCEFGLPDETPGLDALDEQSMRRTCPDCDGKGKRPKPGDTDSRKLLLEMVGVTGKRGGGPAVQITQNFGGANIEAAQDKLNKISFEIGDEVVDADPAAEREMPDA